MIAASFAISNSLALIISYGMPFYIQREVARTVDGDKRNLSIYVSVYAYSSVFYISVVLAVWLLFFKDIEVLMLLLISVTIYFLNFASVFNAVFTGLSEFKLQFKLQFLTKISTAITIIILIFLHTGILYILFVLLISSVIYFAIVLLFINLRYGKAIVERVSMAALLKEIFKIFPLYIASVCNFLYDKIDILIISQFLDYNLVAVYSVAYGLYKSATLFFSFIISDFYTKLSKRDLKSDLHEVIFNKYTLTILIITATCSAAIYIFADFGIKLIYSEKYNGSSVLLRIMSLGVILMGLNNYTGTVLNAFGLFKENMVVTIIALVFNVVMNIILIPLYGLISAAYVTLITEFLVLTGDVIYIFIHYRKVQTAYD
jgi:O-antigen/teichoic acid export membrane protein